MSSGGNNQSDQNINSKGGSIKKEKYIGKYPSTGGNTNKHSRGSMDGGGNWNTAQNQIQINIERDFELKKTENAYQVKRMAEMDEHEQLLRDVRIILNKLTPQNLQKLTGDLINLPINTQKRLEDCIDIIFEKSIDEQVFSQTYAQLCRVLSGIKVPIQNETGKVANFRSVLGFLEYSDIFIRGYNE